MELIHLGIKEKDPRTIKMNNLSDLLDDLLQYRLQLQGLASGSSDGVEAGKLMGPLFQLVIELRMVDGLGRPVCDRGEKLDLFIGKLMLFFRVKAKGSQGLVFSNQWESHI